MITNELHKKVDQSLRLLDSAQRQEKDGQIEVSYSGGKDSDVILELAKMAGINARPIYKNTTIDPPGTISHCKKKGVEIVNPKESFFQLVERKGCPTMRARFCCEVLKEYKILDIAIQGIRKSESVKRAKNYNEPELCRTYPDGNKVRVYYPILYWTDDDLKNFIDDRGVKCHPLYYDERGYFHVERRLGCIGCPLRADKGKGDFIKYPLILKQIIKKSQIFIENHPNSSAALKFKNAYNLMYHNLFHNSYESYKNSISCELFPELTSDSKAFLERYFNINLEL